MRYLCPGRVSWGDGRAKPIDLVEVGLTSIKKPLLIGLGGSLSLKEEEERYGNKWESALWKIKLRKNRSFRSCCHIPFYLKRSFIILEKLKSHSWFTTMSWSELRNTRAHRKPYSCQVLEQGCSLARARYAGTYSPVASAVQRFLCMGLSWVPMLQGFKPFKQPPRRIAPLVVDLYYWDNN